MSSSKNEYGINLDSNGYAPSILSKKKECRICGTTREPLQRHEIYNGPNRQKSKAYGLWAWICPKCHTRISQENGHERMLLKEVSQNKAMQYYGWNTDDFRKRFGKNYL